VRASVISLRRYFGLSDLDPAIFKVLRQRVILLRDLFQLHFRIELSLRPRQSAGTLGLFSIVGSTTHNR
jgi:hypothetical protein